METGWDERSVKVWLEGQRSAALETGRERARSLLKLRPDEAFRIYLGLWEARPRPDGGERPSPMLMAMRRLLARHADDRAGET